MMAKIFFIIGLRRSGTSILRTLLAKHPEISDVEFEPHDLWHAVDLNHFQRLMKKNNVINFVNVTINTFRKRASIGKWYGAKFALNPGTKALEWVWLCKTFPEAKFIFIKRPLIHTYSSAYKQDKDSVRGMINERAYFTLAAELNSDFETFSKDNSKACCIQYENLVKNADKELIPVWKLLNIKPLTGLNAQMRKPENWSG